MILDYFTTNRDLQSRYTWEDLQAVKFSGDAKLEETFSHWHMVISCASFDMSERTKIQSFLALFRASAKLSHDIQAFDRMRPDDPNNCLKYLTDAVERIISFDRLDRNRKAKIQQLSGGSGRHTSRQGTLSTPPLVR